MKVNVMGDLDITANMAKIKFTWIWWDNTLYTGVFCSFTFKQVSMTTPMFVRTRLERRRRQ